MVYLGFQVMTKKIHSSLKNDEILNVASTKIKLITFICYNPKVKIVVSMLLCYQVKLYSKPLEQRQHLTDSFTDQARQPSDRISSFHTSEGVTFKKKTKNHHKGICNLG